MRIDDVNDARDFEEANQAFHDIGFTESEERDLYRVIAGILCLGNVKFSSNNDESIVDPSAEDWFQKCAAIFCVDVEAFRKGLLFKKVRGGGGKRSSVAFSPYSPEAAIDTRDAFSKEIYRRCFDFIVSKINFLMYDSSVRATGMVGVLDIFGFEIFKQVLIMIIFHLY
jgi:myosin I